GIVAETFLGNFGTSTAAGIFQNASGGDILVGTSGVEKTSRFRVDGAGNVFAKSYNTSGADFAESVAASGPHHTYHPGDVLVIDQASNRQVKQSQSPYSHLVAGIYSTKPGIVASPYAIGHAPISDVPLAVVG